MIIRPAASLEEVEQAHHIEKNCYSPETAATPEAFRQRFEAFPSYFLIAELHGAIVGVTNGVRLHKPDLADESIKQCRSFESDGAHFCILTVAVDPRYLRRGIGSALVRHLLDQARKDRLESVLLMCEEHLIPFYRSLGFRYVKLSASDHGGIRWHEMEQQLAGRSDEPFVTVHGSPKKSGETRAEPSKTS